MITKEEIIDYCKKRIETVPSERHCSDAEKEYCISVLKHFIDRLEKASLDSLELAKAVYLAETIYDKFLVEFRTPSVKIINGSLDKISDFFKEVFCSEEMYYQLRDESEKDYKENWDFYTKRMEKYEENSKEYKRLWRECKRFTQVEKGKEFYVANNTFDDVNRFIDIFGYDFLDVEYIKNRILRGEINPLTFLL